MSTTNLNDIPEDVQHLILAELVDPSSPDVHNLAQSSIALRNAASPFLYGNLVLNTGPETRNYTAYQALIQKFREDDHWQIATHVRTLTVKDGVPSEDLVLVLDRIAESGNLYRLNWETSAHMPDAILEKIPFVFPDLEISVMVLNRHDAHDEAHRQMDVKLLSSPRLVRLVYTIYHRDGSRKLPCRSEWRKLCKALTTGGNVRSLCIQYCEDTKKIIVPATEPLDLARFDCTSGKRLLKLEELRITSNDLEIHVWDDQQCRLLHGSIDCSRLRMLSIQPMDPKTFYCFFTGLLPGLKSLRVRVVPDCVANLSEFIQSIDSLQHIHFSNSSQLETGLWPAIVKHSKALRSLTTDPTLVSYRRSAEPSLSFLQKVQSTFPRLEHFTWHAPYHANQVDPQHLAVLSSMQLKKLDLCVHISYAACELSDELVAEMWGGVIPPINRHGAINAAIKIAEAISASQPDPLQCLTLDISRGGHGDRGDWWPMGARFQIRNKGGPRGPRGDKYEVRGTVDWYNPGYMDYNGRTSLREQLLLEEP